MQRGDYSVLSVILLPFLHSGPQETSDQYLFEDVSVQDNIMIRIKGSRKKIGFLIEIK